MMVPVQVVVMTGLDFTLQMVLITVYNVPRGALVVMTEQYARIVMMVFQLMLPLQLVSVL